MKKFKLMSLIICFVISMFCEILYSQNFDIPDVKVIIKKKHLLPKRKKERKLIINQIRKSISSDFKAAWQAIETNIGKLHYCYRNAFSDYKNLIKNQFGNKFVIHFDFTEDFISYQIIKGLYFSKDNFPGNHSGNARPAPVNGIKIFNVYAPKWNMIRYSKKVGDCYYEYILSEVTKYFCENGLDTREDYDLLKNHQWYPNGTVSFSIKNMIIHEIFHIVLGLSSHQDLKTRFPDEATISDTVARISPLAGDGKGGYWYYYEFISWLLDNQASITIPIPFKTVKHFLNDLHFFLYRVLKNNSSFGKMDANKMAIINGEKRGCKW